MMTRLRIGHTLLTHKFILDKEDPPKCMYCNDRLTIKHIIVNCPGLDHVREKIGIANSMKEALADDKDSSDKIIQLLQQIGLMKQI